MPKINVRCGSRVLAVDVDLNESPMLLKAQLFALTEIPPERQKLLIKGKAIGDENWSGIAIKDGSTIMLMGGSALSTKQVTTTENLEDKELKDQKAKTEPQIILPAGLANLGNTCYMNATLQCFKVIPELNAAIKKYTGGDQNGNSHATDITKMLKKLYEQMDSGTSRPRIVASDLTESEHTVTVTPLFFLHVLHTIFPQFVLGEQQDANECFCELLRLISDELIVPTDNAGSSNNEKLKKFFEIKYQVKTKCLEEGSTEELQTSVETGYQASCFLNQSVRYIQSGIKCKMTEEIEKQSEELGRNAKYEKSSLIDRLPAYLSVQIVRFFFKEKDNNLEIKVNAKILKDVKFPMVLDMYDTCTPELQQKLKPARQQINEYEETRMEMLRNAKLAEDPSAKKPCLKPKGFQPNTFSDDIGSNNSGFYELKALITHKGRASNSGHYVAWIRVGDGDDDEEENKKNNNQENAGNSKWAACDDTDVYPVSEAEILKLSGGGDWHC
uniref:Ubiquitin carboxyl-terminal hydrolase n=1 Tax=Meloidogyne hapla TaxID=6305 RepID=A0A1I8BDA7_MELHA